MMPLMQLVQNRNWMSLVRKCEIVQVRNAGQLGLQRLPCYAPRLAAGYMNKTALPSLGPEHHL
jgi:hypothetical protein